MNVDAEMVAWHRMQTTRLPQTYLGRSLSLSDTKLNLSVFASLIAKTDKYLVGWQASLLSPASRTILINVVLNNLPTYDMAALLLPKGIVHALDSRRRVFL